MSICIYIYYCRCDGKKEKRNSENEGEAKARREREHAWERDIVLYIYTYQFVFMYMFLYDTVMYVRICMHWSWQNVLCNVFINTPLSNDSDHAVFLYTCTCTFECIFGWICLIICVYIFNICIHIYIRGHQRLVGSLNCQVFSDKAPSNKIYRRASSEQRPRRDLVTYQNV